MITNLSYQIFNQFLKFSTPFLFLLVYSIPINNFNSLSPHMKKKIVIVGVYLKDFNQRLNYFNNTNKLQQLQKRQQTNKKKKTKLYLILCLKNKYF